MGNKSSKIAAAQEQLDAIEKRLAAKDRTLAGKEQELQASKTEGTTALKETQALRKQIQELGEHWATIEQDREKQAAKLKEELELRGSEVEGHRRTAEDVRVERDALRKKVVELMERARNADREKEAALQTAGEQKAQLETVSSERELESQKALTESSRFQTQIEELRQAQLSGSEELTAAKAALQEESQKREQWETNFQQTTKQLDIANEVVAATKIRLAGTEDQFKAAQKQLVDSDDHLARMRQQLAEVQREHTNAASELSAAQASAAASADSKDRELVAVKRQLASIKEYLGAVEKELATARSGLQQSQDKFENLQRGHNESISRKSALHESFQALKLELTESHEAYRQLRQECDTLRLAAQRAGGATAMPGLGVVS